MPDSKKPLTPGQEPGAKAGADELNPQHELFCREFLVDLNATQAYLRVYKCSPDVANTNGPRLLVKAGIQARIRALMKPTLKKLDLSRERILAEYASRAFGHLGQVMEWNEGGTITLKSSSELSPRRLRLLKKIKVSPGEFGNTIDVELKDSDHALDKVADYVGLFDRGAGDDKGDGSTPDRGVLDSLRKSAAGRKKG